MKKIILVFLSTFSLHILSQNSEAIFEFGRDFESEFYYDFIDNSLPFVNLSKSRYFSKRKELKIKSIVIRHNGLSLDSLFLTNNKYFKLLIQGWGVHSSPIVIINSFDRNGFLVSSDSYPICNFLNKKDSLSCNYMKLNSTLFGDTLKTFQYKRDAVEETSVYLNNVIYSIKKDNSYIFVSDSTNAFLSSKYDGYKLVPTYYYFDVQNRIKQILHNNMPNNFYNLKFYYPNKRKAIVSLKKQNIMDDTICDYKNKIVFNRHLKIKESCFYSKDYLHEYSCYKFKYDSHNNLVLISRKSYYENWFDYCEDYYSFKHTYKNGKLSKSLAHYNFRVVSNDVIYYYNDQGLVSEINYSSGGKVTYEYTFYN